MELSKETLEKFEEINKGLEDEEEAVIVAQEEEEVKPTFLNPRKGDEGLNEDGTVVVEDEEKEEESEEEKPEEEVEKEEPVGEEEPEKEEKKEEPPEASTAEATLPRRLIQAAYRNGFTDDDILTLGERAEPVLTKMADNTDAVSAKLGQQGRQEKAELSSQQPQKLSLEKDDYEEDKFGKVEQHMNALQDRLGRVESAEQKRQREYVTSTCDTYFDAKTEEYPEFGKTESLTQQQDAVRQKIYAECDLMQTGARGQGWNMPLSQGLDRAFSIYEANNAKTTIRSKIVDEAKKRSKQLTSRPSKRKTKEKYSDPRQKAMDNYRKKAAELGHTLPADDED